MRFRALKTRLELLSVNADAITPKCLTFCLNEKKNCLDFNRRSNLSRHKNMLQCGVMTSFMTPQPTHRHVFSTKDDILSSHNPKGRGVIYGRPVMRSSLMIIIVCCEPLPPSLNYRRFSVNLCLSFLLKSVTSFMFYPLQKKFVRIFASLQIFLIGRKKTDFCGRVKRK